MASPSSVLKFPNRDFKILYGEAVVRRQIVKITSDDVVPRVPLRLPAVVFFVLRESA